MSARRQRSVPCEWCARLFFDNSGLYLHMKAKHGRRPRIHLRDDFEPSLAEMAIEARMRHKMGEPVEEWLDEMFGISEEGQRRG